MGSRVEERKPYKHSWQGSLYVRISRAFLVMMTTLAAVQLVVVAMFWNRISAKVEQGSNWSVARNLAVELQPLLRMDVDFWQLFAFARTYTLSNPQISLYLVSASGKILADLRFGDAPESGVVPVEQLKRFVLGSPEDAPVFILDPADLKQQAVFSAAPLNVFGEPGYLLVVLGNDRRGKMLNVLQAQALLPGSLITLGLMLLAAAAIGYGGFYLLTRRFRSLVMGIEEFGKGDYSHRLPVEREDEVGALAYTFNTMAETIGSYIKEIERRDRLRRELIADISHDLRRPGSIISAHTELMLREQDKLSDAVREQTTAISRSAQSLNQMLAELFDLAKLEAREAQPSREPFSLEELGEEVVSLYIQKGREEKIDVELRCPPGLPMVVGDIVMIGRVLTNLVENALRYTPAGGRVTIEVQPGEGRAEISVIDTGAGIREKDLPHVLNRSYQADDNDRPHAKGLSGLGLAIVRRIVEAHGSEVKIVSSEGQGTTFSFSLSYAPTSPHSETLPPEGKSA